MQAVGVKICDLPERDAVCCHPAKAISVNS
jgi:hypothetical protein